jgi:hypothetical protein
MSQRFDAERFRLKEEDLKKLPVLSKDDKLWRLINRLRQCAEFVLDDVWGYMDARAEIEGYTHIDPETGDGYYVCVSCGRATGSIEHTRSGCECIFVTP